jgi:hypothetical protein
MKKHLKIDIQMDEHNAEEGMEIAENVPLLQNAYKIFKNNINNHWKENSERNTLWHRKKLPVTGRNLTSQEETYSQGKKLNLTGRSLLSQ